MKFQTGTTVLTDKGVQTHTVVSEDGKTVCGKDATRLFKQDRPFWSPSCKVCSK